MSRFVRRAPRGFSLFLAGATAILFAASDETSRVTAFNQSLPQTAEQGWTAGQPSPDGVWQVGPDEAPAAALLAAAAPSPRSVRVNAEAMASVLRGARRTAATLYLPRPSGRFERFRLVESSVLQAPLDAAYPDIMTFTVESLEDRGVSGRLSLTPLGFHALIVTPAGQSHVIEKQGDGADAYRVYAESDQAQPGTSQCLVPQVREQATIQRGLLDALQPTMETSALVSGATLRTYRVAIGATAEFTQSVGGGTVAGALSAIVQGINAANVVLEKEAAIRLELVANETAIIYTDTATDGYTHLDLATMATENHAKLPAVIGAGNYDLGHVFDAGPGLAAQGYAFFGVCLDEWKDRAGTIFWGVSPSHPVGLRTLLHEFGHQFNAYHSFNGTTNSCAFGRDAVGAYEPGSGSSIMSYADLCGAENVPATSLYHAGSLEQMINYTIIGLGASCGVSTDTGNHPPTVDAGSDYTIPAATPFVLTGSGSDVDGDAVTYSWEQFDLGAASPPNTDDGTRPLFRIYDPTSSPVRIFPELSYILANTTAVGQSLPTTDRTMTFRLVARDNRAAGGGVTTDDAVLTVDASSGPFAVTSPNTPVTWPGNSTQTVTWDVAGTSVLPVGVANVRILLSTDNGQTFPTVLAASTPNDGSQNVTVPNVATSNARIKIEAVGNIFFDISNAKFNIALAGGQPNLIVKTVATVPGGGYVLAGQPASIKERTMNTGTGMSSASRTKFYLSADKKLNAGDTLLEPTAGRDVPALAAGAFSEVVTAVSIPALGVGTYYLLAVADADNTNAETNESDNVKAGTLFVGPDVAVKKLTLSPASAPAGAAINVTLETTNKGKQSAGASVSRIYYSADNKLNVGTDTLLATINIAALNSGQTSTDARSVTIPAGAQTGQRFIIAVVDAASQVVEANEKNDKAAKLIVQ
jgi:hypothetical protein